MKAPTNYVWTCPTCGAVILIPVEVEVGSGKGISLRVAIADTDAADAIAHVWTHAEGA